MVLYTAVQVHHNLMSERFQIMLNFECLLKICFYYYNLLDKILIGKNNFLCFVVERWTFSQQILYFSR